MKVHVCTQFTVWKFYGNSLSRIFGENFVKVTDLLDKLLKSWFHEIFCCQMQMDAKIREINWFRTKSHKLFLRKIHNFSVKSTFLLKKLLTTNWFYGNFWAWSRLFVVIFTLWHYNVNCFQFHDFFSSDSKILSFFHNVHGRSEFNYLYRSKNQLHRSPFNYFLKLCVPQFRPQLLLRSHLPRGDHFALTDALQVRTIASHLTGRIVVKSYFSVSG